MPNSDEYDVRLFPHRMKLLRMRRQLLQSNPHFNSEDDEKVSNELEQMRNCVQLQVYRDSKARWGGATSKASLSLQRYLGCDTGFTLDKHSHTLALICQDFTAVLAFETRERLMQWQVKLQSHLGWAKQWVVVVAAGGRLAAGPARLLLRPPAAALASGVPPKLLAVWELSHLRRYGVVEGRFCLEGGSLCGKSEGLHVLVSDQAAEIARDFEIASRGNVSPRRRYDALKNEGMESPKLHKAFQSNTRLSELNTIDRSLPPIDLRIYEDPCIEESGAISPYWPSAERTDFHDMGLGDTVSVNETVEGVGASQWNGTNSVMIERCMSCISKLGALSRSSTAALTPGAKHFSPAWTMEELSENLQSNNGLNGDTKSCEALPILNTTENKTEEICCCTDKPPIRPPKPTKLELNLNKVSNIPMASRSRSYSHLSALAEAKAIKVGPYENYDVPKVPSAEVDGEYYDTPKRVKECLNRELFKMTRSSTTNTLVLKKPCGCLLKLGKKPKEPTIIDTEESFQSASCPCRRVTDWAHAWIRLPYCRRNRDTSESTVPNKENMTSSNDRNALYAKVDLSRKTRRNTNREGCITSDVQQSVDVQIDEGPLANYENLSFALSLENYENAKNLLRKVGITETELDAIGANLKPESIAGINKKSVCSKCEHQQIRSDFTAPGERVTTVGSNDEYLMMEPSSLDSDRLERDRTLAAGYTPMSPIGGFAFHTLKYPAKSAVSRLLEEKSASNPALCPEKSSEVAVEGSSVGRVAVPEKNGRQRAGRGRRSSSVDSSRFLEDVEEFEGSVGSRGSASSMETLRDLSGERAGVPCVCSSRSTGVRAGDAVVVPAGARDSCSSNDSGVSSWSLRSAMPPPAAIVRSADITAPVLPGEPIRGVTDAQSTSSGTSDMSDYVETLSMCSSQSSSDTPLGPCQRRAASTLRPRAGQEYRPLAPRR
ncbi:unnamed protein product [Parnassius apollo]|uniref:(apollo) hypothetical protein n=1 Tax=Parnassius apollo TaxID=110799 RepID=A0A8S3WPJ2_PARAO|nr:unnamed protein product [Parnassius apollo]